MTAIKDEGLVSVIIPAYNRGSLLRDALESVRAQTYRPLELIVVDDGSEEDIRSIVEEFRQRADFPVIYIRQENRGPGAARRVGLEHASGEFTQYLDSDDIILPEKIELQVQALRANPEAVMCYCVTLVNMGEGISKRCPPQQAPPDLLEGALSVRPWTTSATLWRYPSGFAPVWPDSYNNEDLAHDISVGMVARKTVFVPKVLVLVCWAHRDRVSATGTAGQLSRFQARNVYTSWVTCLNLAMAHGIGRWDDCTYASLLWERVEKVSRALVRARCWRLAALLLVRSIAVAPTIVHAVHTCVLVCSMVLSFGRAPWLYRNVARVGRYAIRTFEALRSV